MNIKYTDFLFSALQHPKNIYYQYGIIRLVHHPSYLSHELRLNYATRPVCTDNRDFLLELYHNLSGKNIG